jgi:hypothetical protein
VYYNPGKYNVSLVAKIGQNCFDSLYVQKDIVVNAKPKAFFISILDTTKHPYRVIDVKNLTDSAQLFLWNFGDNDQLYSGKDYTYRYQTNDSSWRTITLYAKNNSGCDSTYSTQIKLPAYWKGLFVPNAFTPDYGTDEVRVFKPAGVSLKYYHLKIFNKWGELLWETTELTPDGQPARGWDGTNANNGSACMQGAYIWTIEAEFSDGTGWPGMLYPGASEPVTKGNVTLIR